MAEDVKKERHNDEFVRDDANATTKKEPESDANQVQYNFKECSDAICTKLSGSIDKLDNNLSKTLKHQILLFSEDVKARINEDISETKNQREYIHSEIKSLDNSLLTINTAIKQHSENAYGKLSESIDKLGTNLDESLTQQLQLSIQDIKTKIDEDISETKNQKEFIHSGIKSLGGNLSEINTAIGEYSDEIRKLSGDIDKLGTNLDESLTQQLQLSTRDIKTKIDEDINETKNQKEFIHSEIKSLDNTLLVINSTFNDLSNQIADSQKKYGEIEILYEKEKEISQERARRIEELIRTVDEEKVTSSKLRTTLTSKESELKQSEEQNDNLNSDKKNLESFLKDTREKLSITENELLETKEELSVLRSGKMKVDQDYLEMKTHYENLNIDENLVTAYKEYCSLTSKTKDDLNSIFPKPTFLGFISCGLRLSNVTSLWEFAKKNAFNNVLDDMQKINKIFCILIDVYNEGFTNKQYELITPSIGSKFDSSSSSERQMKPDGTVQEVFLSGYRSIKDGNIHKAVISVGQ